MIKSRLKFLVDVGVGKSVEYYLSNQGFDVKTIRSINPRMRDIDILRIAVFEKRMVITMDKDFGELVFRKSEEHEGVLILRMEDATGIEKSAVISEIIEQYEEHIKGKFCVYSNGILRIR